MLALWVCIFGALLLRYHPLSPSCILWLGFFNKPAIHLHVFYMKGVLVGCGGKRFWPFTSKV